MANRMFHSGVISPVLWVCVYVAAAWAGFALGAAPLAGQSGPVFPQPRGPSPAATVPPAMAAVPPPAEELVAEVRIVGNKALPVEKITPHIRTRVGRPFNPQTIEEDARRLDQTGMFMNVRTFWQRVPNGRIVIFEVLERPILMEVLFVGNEKIRKKALGKEAGLKTGDPLDTFAVEEARRKLEAYYRSKGYDKVRITLLEGSKPEDRRAIFEINEGVKKKVQVVTFVGNTIASDERLATRIETRSPVLYLFKGELDRKELEEDVQRLTAYYRGLGFFQAKIGYEVRDFDLREHYDYRSLFSRAGRELNQFDSAKWVVVTFVINEGPRFKIRNISVKGNTKYSAEELLSKMQLQPGEHFNQAKVLADRNTLEEKYGGVGYVFCDVKAEPRFLEPGLLDIVYEINEGDCYQVGKIGVMIKGDYPHTKITAVINRISLHPGDIADTREMKASERRLRFSGLFENNPAQGEPPKIVFSPPMAEDEDEDNLARRPKPPSRVRMQNPDPRNAPAQEERVIRGQYTPSSGRIMPKPRSRLPWLNGQDPPPAPPMVSTGEPAPATTLPTNSYPPTVSYPNNTNGVASTQPSTSPGSVPVYPQPGYGPAVSVQPPAPTSVPPPAYRPQNPSPYTGMPPSYPPPAPVQPSPPYGNAAGAQPLPVRPVATPIDPNSPFYTGPPDSAPLRDLPLTVQATETQTGRFMVGAGVNSEAGLFGSIVIDEQNFDLFRFPRGWSDIRNFTAFRGAGQRLRIEAVPGSEIQRYMINFQEPYLMNTAVNMGLSGYYYNRLFREWFEERVGGRMALGYQFTPDFSGSLAYRGARVNITSIVDPAVPELLEVQQTNALHGFQTRLAYDTRDNPFLATEGGMIEASFEQVIGTWNYPRAELDVRRHFTLRERPDGSGRHVLTLSSRAGYTGPNTPIYEHFYAGGFSTIRGFDFRGASPRSAINPTVFVGGEFLLLASAEYMFPITADDMLRAVVFCDSGTVEPTINDWSDRYRVAPGFGLRITVPAMGPAPIALDFAFPVSMNDGDREEVFSFFIGFGRN